MKKYILILILSALCFCKENAFTSETYTELDLTNKKNSNYQLELVPKVEIEYYAGRENFTRYVTNKDTADYIYGQLKTRVGLDFKFGPMILYFDTHTYMNPSEAKASFSPRHVDFYSGFSFKMTENVKFTFEHLCVHPVKAFDNNSTTYLYGGYNSIKISYNY